MTTGRDINVQEIFNVKLNNEVYIMSKSNTELLKTQFLQLMVITMEECGELIQECSKSMRRNDENHQP